MPPMLLFTVGVLSFAAGCAATAYAFASQRRPECGWCGSTSLLGNLRAYTCLLCGSVWPPVRAVEVYTPEDGLS